MTDLMFGRRFKAEFKEILFSQDPVMGEFVATKIVCEILLWKATPEQGEVIIGDEDMEQLQYGATNGNFLKSHKLCIYFEASACFNISLLQKYGQQSVTITPA